MLRPRVCCFVLCAALAACSSGSQAPDAAVATDADATPDGATSDVATMAWAPPAACVDAGAGGASDGGVAASGNAFAFTLRGGHIEGAYVTLLEHPERCARTAADGAFRFDGLAPGETVTLRMHHPMYPLIQTGTHALPMTGLERLTFQAPDYSIYGLLSSVTATESRPDRCQIATTVTEVGRSLYTAEFPSHGEAGATVTISPTPPEADGPIYFQYYGAGQILPDRSLRETTRDGGVLFLNVTPGDYVLSAHKAGVNIRDVRVRCVAGVLVNASPPWGLQVY